MAPQLISDPIWAHMAQNTPFDPFSPPEHSWQDGPHILTLGSLKWPITLISDPFWHYGPKRVKKGHFGPLLDPFWEGSEPGVPKGPSGGPRMSAFGPFHWPYGPKGLKRGPKRGPKPVIWAPGGAPRGSKMTRFWTPFWTPLARRVQITPVKCVTFGPDRPKG